MLSERVAIQALRVRDGYKRVIGTSYNTFITRPRPFPAYNCHLVKLQHGKSLHFHTAIFYGSTEKINNDDINSMSIPRT